jgi:signal transduction histidine kinase
MYGWTDAGDWVPDLLAGWTIIGCGLAAWARRPQSRSGLLLTAAGFAWFLPDFASSGWAVLGWLGAQARYVHRGPLVQLVLTYPRGRIRGRVEGAVVAAGYAAGVFVPVWGSKAVTILLAAVLVAVAATSYLAAAGRERRMRRSALQATVLFSAGVAGIALTRFAVPEQPLSVTRLPYEVMLCALAVGLLIGLMRWPWERADVADLVVELGETRSRTLRDELARALGDPSLQVGYRLGADAAYVDATGRPVAIPDPGSGRSATVVERDGQPLAVLVHDPAVLGDPGLVEAVSSAAGLAAANARLQEEVRARLAEIAASRLRILTAGDEERERLEYRLRDGAQRRLGELSQTLRLARESAIGQAAAERIIRAELQLARTQEDLGRLAHGLHPSELAEQGLAAALAALADDIPLQVDLTVAVTATSQPVAACAYFVCSEALANVAKHASASSVHIWVTERPGAIAVSVADDGVGGADPQGRGIRGLADRVETFGGTLTVATVPGQGTRLTAVIPDGAAPP